MKPFRLIFGLALIPIGAFLGSFIPIGTGGSGILIGFVVGIGLSCLFLIYGPGHKKKQLPTSYYLNHDDSIPVLGPMLLTPRPEEAGTEMYPIIQTEKDREEKDRETEITD